MLVGCRSCLLKGGRPFVVVVGEDGAHDARRRRLKPKRAASAAFFSQPCSSLERLRRCIRVRECKKSFLILFPSARKVA
jgi:hypothetical protein